MNKPATSMTNIKNNGVYFQQKKKGQMNQLKNALNTIIHQNDSKKGREVIRKVIGYMTLGMDASPLFPQMCKASYMNDQVIKKMIYFYLTTYAEDNPDLAIMAVNTFKKDCKHTSPKIRGLALRNLCSFRSADYVNNTLPMIRQLLNDFQPYVKKTAIMGLLKIFYVQPETILHDQSIIRILADLIRDQDCLVSANAVMALDQILISEGGIPLNKRLYMYLINRLKQYTEWQQVCMLELLYRFQLQPEDQKERYEVLGILWDKLKHSSTPLVLGSIKIILKFTQKKQQLYKNIVQKIKAPLLTLITGNQNSGSYQTMFCVLQHIEYVILNMGGKQYFQKQFKYFYCKADQPTYIRSLKIKILGNLANEYNLGDLLNQLNDYTTDPDEEMARKAVRTLTNMALNLPEVSKPLLININSYFKMGKPHLTNETCISFHQILRKYPKLFSQIGKSLMSYKNQINQNQAIKSFIWLLGTFSQHIDQSPYALQQFIQDQEKFNNFQSGIKEVLLTSIIQTFLKRPAQTFTILKNIFKLIFTSQKSSINLLDHASFYYTALSDNPQEVRKSFIGFQSQMSKYKEDQTQPTFDQDFNSLCIIYKRKQWKYIKPYEYFIAMRNKQLGLIQPPVHLDAEEEQQQPLQHEQQQLGQSNIQNIQADYLQQDLALSSQQFEQIYQSLDQGVSGDFQTMNDESVVQQSIQQLFKMWKIHTMASSQQDNILRFYFYAKDTRDQAYYCIELQLNKNQHSLSLQVKSKNQKTGNYMLSYIRQFLQLNELIHC